MITGAMLPENEAREIYKSIRSFVMDKSGIIQRAACEVSGLKKPIDFV